MPNAYPAGRDIQRPERWSATSRRQRLQTCDYQKGDYDSRRLDDLSTLLSCDVLEDSCKDFSWNA
jgi:hypothetical protein